MKICEKDIPKTYQAPDQDKQMRLENIAAHSKGYHREQKPQNIYQKFEDCCKKIQNSNRNALIYKVLAHIIN